MREYKCIKVCIHICQNMSDTYACILCYIHHAIKLIRSVYTWRRRCSMYVCMWRVSSLTPAVVRCGIRRLCPHPHRVGVSGPVSSSTTTRHIHYILYYTSYTCTTHHTLHYAYLVSLLSQLRQQLVQQYHLATAGDEALFDTPLLEYLLVQLTPSTTCGRRSLSSRLLAITTTIAIPIATRGGGMQHVFFDGLHLVLLDPGDEERVVAALPELHLSTHTYKCASTHVR